MERLRKAHKKSRDGCTQCKDRHIRCNEERPQCLNCKRLSLSCSFSSPALASMPLNEDSLADLELLDHWYRYSLIPGSSEHDQRAKYDYTRLGFSHPYLLNSMLALVSLRRFGEDRSCTRWYARALAHQQAAITRAKPHFQQLDNSHHKALLAFSTFTSLYAVAEPLHRPATFNHERADSDPIHDLLHAIRLGRQTTAFVQENLGSVAASDSYMASKYSHERLEVACNLDTRFSQLPVLRDLIQGLSEGEQQASCLDSVDRLFTCMKVLLDNPGNNSHIMAIFTWAKDVDSIFLDMCSARHPVALITLAHFGALMSLSQGFWLLQGWPSALMRSIREELKDYGDILRWPTELISQSSNVSCSAMGYHDLR